MFLYRFVEIQTGWQRKGGAERKLELLWTHPSKRTFRRKIVWNRNTIWENCHHNSVEPNFCFVVSVIMIAVILIEHSPVIYVTYDEITTNRNRLSWSESDDSEFLIYIE
ncbi:hypothetical protein DICVIV_08000 [Dictyocaulus viviparus]|uniref:Uncharacterized protein n=1 Tax=Dictyocaulus viviparus TaxID=29172 RepID=A0A0D8XN42_DICVI|nr:hypothetical protein DICVIV_08000 [Dictyocaulus viviparus]